MYSMQYCGYVDSLVCQYDFRMNNSYIVLFSSISYYLMQFLIYIQLSVDVKQLYAIHRNKDLNLNLQTDNSFMYGIQYFGYVGILVFQYDFRYE